MLLYKLRVIAMLRYRIHAARRAYFTAVPLVHTSHTSSATCNLITCCLYFPIVACAQTYRNEGQVTDTILHDVTMQMLLYLGKGTLSQTCGYKYKSDVKLLTGCQLANTIAAHVESSQYSTYRQAASLMLPDLASNGTLIVQLRYYLLNCRSFFSLMNFLGTLAIPTTHL